MAEVQGHPVLTPPTSADDDAWQFAVSADQVFAESPTHDEFHAHDRVGRPARSNAPSRSSYALDPPYRAPARVPLNRKRSSISDAGSLADSPREMYSPTVNGGGFDTPTAPATDHSKWIHRDKLARIENEELQAAGIVFPRTRASSKSSRRNTSRDRYNNFNRSEQSLTRRQRINSEPTEERGEDDDEHGSWDLRTPEEAAMDPRPSLAGQRSHSVSRIPVAKTSPLPVPADFVERGAPTRRKSSAGDAESIMYPNTRSRSNSGNLLDESPPSAGPTARKLSVDASPSKKTAKTPASRSASAQRPRTRSGRETNTRPSTRSGEINAHIKTPEGDPPWLENMYKPDPRLPPDQQLLPTVARRLAQEQWEREGKFGTSYDKDLRPLNDKDLGRPLDPSPPTTADGPEIEKQPGDTEWPLTDQLAEQKSPTLSASRPGTAGGYSTMPKIQGKPEGLPALPSPLPMQTGMRIEEPADEPQQKGCGCCIIM